jgi:hypothetical protein
MSLATLTWPQASVYIAVIVSSGFVLAVLVWSIFRTGQTAIRNESRYRERVDRVPSEPGPAVS